MLHERTAPGQVILVEDDPAVRGVLTLLLESEGWRVTEASDGPAGLKLVRRLEADVVVTDLRMPGMSGIQLAHEIAALPETPKVPLVAITSDASDLREAAVRSGRFVTVLSKPLRPGTFLSAVREAAQSGNSAGR